MIGLALVAAVLAGCASTTQHRFALREPMWVDEDRRPFAPKPAEHYNSWIWDGADNTVFRQLSEVWLYEETREAINVNALDEVPDSSWFENRIGRGPLSREALTHGACEDELPPPPPWTIVDPKGGGDTPGFVVEVDGQRYLFKIDIRRPELTTAADSIATRLFHAIGYSTPCNYVVAYTPDYFRIDPEARGDDGEPIAQEEIDAVLEQAFRTPDGLLRGSLSRFIDGDVLGGWRFNGRRGDDPNDIVPHEHRREVRGMYVLSAWLNHIDSRAENNFDSWVTVDGERGYVRHHILDVGDSFGLIWDHSEELTRRFGHSHYLDLEHIGVDLITLGLAERPYHEWPAEDVHPLFTYYDVEHFDPDEWRNGYPNPGFERRTERDTAWMARIIARFTEADLRTLVSTGRFSSRRYADDLVRILRGRQRRILERYLMRLSPLAFPTVIPEGPRSWLCMQDLAVSAGIRAPQDRRYRTTASIDWPSAGAVVELSERTTDSVVCTILPHLGPVSGSPRYLVVDFASETIGDDRATVARAHLYAVGPNQFRLVGLRRPDPG